jgi:hypothetical protein
MIWGHGGLRAVDVYNKYNQAKVGSKWFVERISGSKHKSFANENDAWQYLDMHYPGMDSGEKVELFHRCIPYTTTNMDPLYPEYSGKISHRYGASTVLCTECDTTHLLEARKQATLDITGSISGRCDSRHHYHAIMKKWKAVCLEYENRQKGNNTDQSGDTNGQDGTDNNGDDLNHGNQRNNDDYDNFPSSQDAFWQRWRQ